MTAREFSRLVTACSDLARRDPHGYRVRVFLLATLGYAYIAAVLLLLGGAGALVLWIASGSGGGIASLQLGLPLAGAAWIALRALRVELPPVHGVQLTRDTEPRLFDLIEETRRALRAPRIHRVVLDDSFNAAVMQYPRWGPLGQRNVVLIGYTLLSTLTVDEFRSVLAHELGHVAGNHGRFAIWVYALRTRWLQLLDSLSHEAHWSAFLYRRFFQWYSPYFHAYAQVLSRTHEFDADRAAAAIAGAEAHADGLARAAVTDRFLKARFDPVARRLPGRRTDMPADMPGLLRQAARRAPERPDAQEWLRQALSGTTHPADSHPSISERIRALGVSIPDPAAWCRRLRVNDAQAYASSILDAGDDHADRLAAEWREAAGPQWSGGRERFAQIRAELDAIDARAGSPDFYATDRTTVVGGDAYRRIELIWQIDGAREALPHARSLAGAKPDSAEASFLLGCILAELDDTASIEHLERAMTLEAALARGGLATGFSLLRRLGLEADAALFEQRWESVAAESAESVWTSPMSEADRARIDGAQSVAEPERNDGLRFRRSTKGGTYASAILLGVAGLMLAFFAWAWFTPRLVPAELFFLSAGIAIVSLIAFMVLRRRIEGEVDVVEDGVRVRTGKVVRTMRWTEVRNWRMGARSVTLVGGGGRIRLPVRRQDFEALCNEVARRVVSARRNRNDARGDDARSRSRTGPIAARAKVHEFRRSRSALVVAFLLQLGLAVTGAFGYVEIWILGMIGLGITTWRVARTPSAVSVGLRWIRIRRPTGTESILLAAVADVDIVPSHDRFVVVVLNRFGEPRVVPSVDDDTLRLYDAISTNLAVSHDSAAATSAPAPRAPLRIGLFRPAVALAAAVLLYLPILSGLAVSEAARAGSIPAVRVLLAIGSPIDGRGVGGRTPLYRAAMSGHLELAAMLVERGADPSFGSGPSGFTPLHAAAEGNHRDMVAYLLDLGVDPDITNERNQTPLYQLAWQTKHGDNVPTARLLLDRGADVNGNRRTGGRPLHQAVEASNDALVELLASRGADVNAAGAGGSYALHSAAAANDVAMTALLLRLGASIDARRESDAMTPLAVAAFHRSAATVELLVRSGADTEIADADGNRPVHLLVLAGADEKAMRVLLEHGADPNTVGAGGLRALPGSILAHRNDLALALLDGGADPDLAAREWTPLRAAFRTRNQEMVDELYRRGAN